VTSTSLVLDADMSASETGLLFKIVSDISVDLLRPKRHRVPMGSVATGASLSTTIGSGILTVDTNLLVLNTQIGDVVEILEGDDQGSYSIVGFDTSGGGTTPIVDRLMTNSESGLSYAVYGADSGVQVPLVRIKPEGVRLADSVGQPTDITVPYALPVEARLKDSVRGVKELAKGTVGFTLPGLGEAFAVAESACASDLDVAINLQAGAAADFSSGVTKEEIKAAYESLIGRKGQYSDGCLDCDDGYIFCVTIDKDKVFLNYAGLPPEGITFITDFFQWLTDVLAAFFPGFIAAIPPILSADAAGIQMLLNKGLADPNELDDVLYQFEICIPAELISCCSNLFVALPDIDLKRFVGAVSDFINAVNDADGAAEVAAMEDIRQQLPRTGPGLSSARVGDTLVVDRGPNAGSYVISSKYEVALDTTIAGSGYGLAVLNAIIADKDYFWLFRLMYRLVATQGDPAWIEADDDKVFSDTVSTIKEIGDVLQAGLDYFVPVLRLAVVGIQGSFPVNSWKAICNSFDVTFPTLPTMPTTPSFVTDCYEGTPCTPTDPFQVIVDFVVWVLEFLEVLGLDVDTDFTLTASDIVATVMDGLRTSYKVGTPSCELWARTYFVEPTTFEASGGSKCQLTWDPTVGPPAAPVILPYEKPTLFTATSGAMELLFAADVDADPFQVIPHKTRADDDPDPRLYPRDMTAGTVFSLAPHDFSKIKLTDLTRPAPIALGIEMHRDRLEVHPELLLLASTVGGIDDTVREMAFLTQRGSNVLTVAPGYYDSLIPATDLRNTVEVGDLVFIEEGLDAGGYVVAAIPTATQIQVDRAVLETTLAILKSGDSGEFDGAGADPSQFIVGGGTFDSNDVGMWLTVWGSHYPGANGSYEILSVDGGGGAFVELDITTLLGDFPPFHELDAFWIVTRAPAVVPDDVDAGGTELVGARPVRVYQKVPVSTPIVDISNSLDATLTTSTFTVEVTLIAADQSFVGNTRQPFRVLRDGVQRISSTQMALNKEGGLFYFDIQVRALGAGDEYLIPEKTRLEPVFGTYKSDGYWYSVRDPNLTFSPEEEVDILFSPAFLPVGRRDELANRVPLLGQSLSVEYEHAPLVAQVQQFLLSRAERTVCANPLARHFLPSFLYLDLTYEGGTTSPTVMAATIRTAIEALDPQDALSLAREVESTLRQRGASDWAHDIWMAIVTHDRNRRLVGNRSRDRLGGDEVAYFDGSNRVSYFIPGPVRSPDSDAGKYLTEDDVPVGERVRAIQQTRVRNLI